LRQKALRDHSLKAFCKIELFTWAFLIEKYKENQQEINKLLDKEKLILYNA